MVMGVTELVVVATLPEWWLVVLLRIVQPVAVVVVVVVHNIVIGVGTMVAPWAMFSDSYIAKLNFIHNDHTVLAYRSIKSPFTKPSSYASECNVNCGPIAGSSHNN